MESHCGDFHLPARWFPRYAYRVASRARDRSRARAEYDFSIRISANTNAVEKLSSLLTRLPMWTLTVGGTPSGPPASSSDETQGPWGQGQRPHSCAAAQLCKEQTSPSQSAPPTQPAAGKGASRPLTGLVQLASPWAKQPKSPSNWWQGR